MFEPLLSNVKKSRFYQEIADEYKQVGIKEGIQKGKQQGIQKGKQEGKQERNREIATTMLKKRMSLKLIEEVTGLSQAELRALKKRVAARKN
jgi:predicted transposase/invertase (TIGR01784 family)